MGYYAYIIGRALREKPDDTNLERALDCLASILILHIGFEHGERWYSTVLLFRFAYEEVRKTIGRELTDKEVRYLTAAVINTLESEDAELLLEPYATSGQIENLRFDLETGKTVPFNIGELPKIVEEQSIGINDFKKTKAALFWAQQNRGIYTRASRGTGIRLISEMVAVDRSCAEHGLQNPIASILEAISINQHNEGIFELAERAFTDFSGLLREWQNLEAELFKATNRAVEAFEIRTAPAVFLDAQRAIRAKGAITETDDVLEAVETPDEIVEGYTSDETGLDEIVRQLGDEPSGSETVPKQKAPPPKQVMPSETDIAEMLGGDISQFEHEPPVGNGASEKKKASPGARVTKTDFATKEARNRDLGEAGERFILEYERKKLLNAGQGRLADRVSWVSKEIGDGLGYDIVSFDENGTEIFLEVKTTTGGKATPFFVSNNEVAVSEEKCALYRLIRVYDFPNDPKFFSLAGNLAESLELEATSYRARIL